MRRSLAVLGLIVSGALAPFSAAYGYMLDPIHVGNWEGGAYYDDGTRLFSHCAVGVEYENGITLLMSWLPVGLAVSFVDARWNTQYVGSEMPVRVEIDDLWTGEGEARVVAPGHIQVIMGREPRPVTAMRRGVQLSATIAKETLVFDLTSTNAAIDALAQCYRRHSS